ncbi:MAG: DUF6241 domain-containing protein [Clostridiaceae bacterium]
MKKSYKMTLIILGMIAALVGIIVTVIGMKSGIDSVLLEGAPMETIEKTEFDEMVEFMDGNYRLTKSYDGAYDDTTINEIYTSIHGMSHNVILADEKWGKKDMTEENINTAIIQVLAIKIPPEEQNTLLQYLTAWKAGDFTKSDHTHNYVWIKQGGTVGLATGVNHDFKADWID